MYTYKCSWYTVDISYSGCGNDRDGARAEHCGARVYLGTIIVSVLSPQLLIPPHSVQAEASGGTVEHDKSTGGPAKL